MSGRAGPAGPAGPAGAPLSGADLSAIAARAAAASRAPWEAFVEERDPIGGASFIRVGGFDHDDEPDMYVLRDRTPAGAADLDFIAHAREDIPRLLAEIERLRALLAAPRPTPPDRDDG